MGRRAPEGAYAGATSRVNADSVTRLQVMVDHTRGKVVSVDPSGEGVHVHSYTVVKPLTPAGPSDDAPCPPGD